jgi:hypothetical protein
MDAVQQANSGHPGTPMALEKTRAVTGLGVVVEVLDKVYQTGRKYAEGFKENMKILFDDLLPKWNYRAVPSTT